jgi:endonuclease YncB( thermonuclease family)
MGRAHALHPPEIKLLMLNRRYFRSPKTILTLTGLFGSVLAATVLGLWGPREEIFVADGDSLQMGEERIRLWGIDAPELHQECTRKGQPYACGKSARQTLVRLIGDRQVTCTPLHRDAHGRTVARCAVEGADLGAQMVQAGWAIDYSRYSKGYYAPQQKEAKASNRGLWSGEFLSPEQWRRQHPRNGG